MLNTALAQILFTFTHFTEILFLVFENKMERIIPVNYF